MGSSLSVYNDTKHKVWIQQGANWEAVVGSLAAVGAVATLGVGAPISAASVAAISAYRANAAHNQKLFTVIESKGLQIVIAPSAALGLTAGPWTIVGLATSAGSSALSYALKLSEDKAKEVATTVQTFIDEAEVLKPGEIFRYDRTLA